MPYKRRPSDRDYDVILHVTIRSEWGTSTHRTHAWAFGKNAQEAKKRARAATLKWLPHAVVVAGGARWLREEAQR